MKNRYLLMLLSVLLCIAMLFTACAKASDEDEETTTEPEETTTEPEETLPPVEVEPEITGKVDPVLENFFKFEVVDTTVLETVERFDGEFVARYEDIVIMKESSINEKNKVTEIFTVYNVNAEEPVLTVKNKFDNGDFKPFDWNDLYINDAKFTSNGANPAGFKYPESVMKVSIIPLPEAAIIEVATAKVKALEVDLEKNPNGNYFEIKTEYAYYDLFGTLINKTAEQAGNLSQYRNLSGDETTYRVTIGDVTAYLDTETGKLVKSIATDNSIKYAGYDVQTAKYGFYMDQYAQGPFGTDRQYFEAYNKQTGELVTRYYLAQADQASAFVLRNGNVLLQYANMLPEDSTHDYDLELMGMRATIDTYVLNIETGALTEIEANYMVESVLPNNQWLDTENFFDKNGLKLTENVVNFAKIYSFGETKTLDPTRYAQLAVLNNDGSLMFAMENIIPEHDIDFHNDLGVRTLKTGDLLVDLVYAAPASRAIVKQDGTVRCYLNDDETVVGQYIVTEKGIYDFDKNLVQLFGGWDGYELFAICGDRIICDVETKYLDEHNVEQTRYSYFVVDATASTIAFNPMTLEEDTQLMVVDAKEEYIIVRDLNGGRYTMYNAKMEHLLTTYDMMSVYEITTGYVVSTVVEGVLLYYTVA